MSHVLGCTGKTKAKMSASTIKNSNRQMSGAQSTGVHLAFSDGAHKGREDLNVMGVASHMLVAAKFVVGPRPRAYRQNKSKNVSFDHKEFR